MNESLLIALLFVWFTYVTACSSIQQSCSNQSSTELTTFDNQSVIKQPAPVITNVTGCANGLTQCMTGDRLTITGSYLSDAANNTQVTFARYCCVVTDQTDRIVHCILPSIPGYDHGSIIPLYITIDYTMWPMDRSIQYVSSMTSSSSSSSSSSTGQHSNGKSDNDTPLGLALGLGIVGVVFLILGLIVCAKKCRSRRIGNELGMNVARIDISAPLLP